MKKKNIFMGCLVIVVFIFFAFVTLTADTSCDTTEPKSMMGKNKVML